MPSVSPYLDGSGAPPAPLTFPDSLPRHLGDSGTGRSVLFAQSSTHRTLRSFSKQVFIFCQNQKRAGSPLGDCLHLPFMAAKWLPLLLISHPHPQKEARGAGLQHLPPQLHYWLGKFPAHWDHLVTLISREGRLECEHKLTAAGGEEL